MAFEDKTCAFNNSIDPKGNALQFVADADYTYSNVDGSD